MSTDALPLPDPATLPDDPVVLKQLVVQLLAELQKAHARLERQEHHMDLLLRRLYGSTSEKFDPQQGLLFDPRQDATKAAEVASASDTSPAPAPPPSSSNRHKHGRGRIPDEIAREEVVHELTEAEKAAFGGAENLIEIGAETSEQLDWRPSTLFVTVHVRKKYARREQLAESGLEPGQQNIVVARKPPEAIPGGLAGPGLLAQVIVSKYTDHLPLYRLEGIFERQGVKLSRQTTDDWVLRCADLLAPLHGLAKQVVLASLALHTDDTPVRVRDAYKKLKYTGRFWTYVGDGRHPLTIFDYTSSRKRDGPAELLKNYRGYLQADAFGGYDGIYTGSDGRIIEAGCWAHARRKFHESRRLDPPRMETVLAWIGKLYAVEKDLRERSAGDWRELSLEEQVVRIAAERQQRSRPLLDGLHVWLESESPKVLPKSAPRAAMDYTLSNWAALCRYVESGWLDIDNNAAENSLRGICLGRKNWLFCGSDRGGRAAAIHFTLLASCKRHGHDPFVYLRDVLRRLPALLPATRPEDLMALLPHRWQPA
jgi:transposase